MSRNAAPHSFFVHNVYSREKIVFAVVEDIVVDGYSRSDKLGDSPFDQLFVAFGVFKLLAYGHTLAGSDQTRQISVQGMVWKSSQFHALGGAVGPPRVV